MSSRSNVDSVLRRATFHAAYIVLTLYSAFSFFYLFYLVRITSSKTGKETNARSMLNVQKGKPAGEGHSDFGKARQGRVPELRGYMSSTSRQAHCRCFSMFFSKWLQITAFVKYTVGTLAWYTGTPEPETPSSTRKVQPVRADHMALCRNIAITIT